MELGLDGRTALVCASTSGLGLATAQALDRAGANIVLSGRRADRVNDLATELRSAIGVAVDLTHPEAADRLVDAATQHFGAVDILVLNNGGPPPSTALETGPEDLARGMELLVSPMQRLLRLTVPAMRQRRWGRVLAIGSSGVDEPIPNLAVSNAARAALAGLLKTLAGEVARDGVTVNMLLPGRIDTPRVRSLDAATAERTGRPAAEVAEDSAAAIPAGRYGTPQEFGDTAAFLCSERASYITGTRVRVDGGMVRH